MTSDRTPINSQYVVVTFKSPTAWPRAEDECWMLNPMRRYVISSDQARKLSDVIATMSDLKGSSLYMPLSAGMGLTSASVLIERNRDRGIGDLMFLTGPMSYLNYVSGGGVKLDVYALSDRGAVLHHHPALNHGTTLNGPLHYDDMGLYNYHWMIDTVTECNEEPDQLNVYDSLYRQLGFNPDQIDPRFKRPSAQIMPQDMLSLDQFFRYIWTHKEVDFRRIGFYVVAPFSAATLRSANYSSWLNIIKEMAARRPVIVVGSNVARLPDTDISVGAFQQAVASMPNVINAIGATSLRLLMALLSRAVCAVTLDSGTLYLAQAVRTPAISIWGSHDPGVRIGYDKDYMDLAIWSQESCRMSPCYAYATFPAHKCPNGAAQACCAVLASITPEQVAVKLDIVESRNTTLGAFSPKSAI